MILNYLPLLWEVFSSITSFLLTNFIIFWFSRPISYNYSELPIFFCLDSVFSQVFFLLAKFFVFLGIVLGRYLRLLETAVAQICMGLLPFMDCRHRGQFFEMPSLASFTVVSCYGKKGSHAYINSWPNSPICASQVWYVCADLRTRTLTPRVSGPWTCQ